MADPFVTGAVIKGGLVPVVAGTKTVGVILATAAALGPLAPFVLIGGLVAAAAAAADSSK